MTGGCKVSLYRTYLLHTLCLDLCTMQVLCDDTADAGVRCGRYCRRCDGLTRELGRTCIVIILPHRISHKDGEDFYV
jgi:hypothetical protein